MAEIEVRGFGKLHRLFSNRGWGNPHMFSVEGPLTAAELRDKMGIAGKDVEVVFINREIRPLSTVVDGGDRVSFVPPGVPSIHRFNLGFYEVRDQ